MRVHRHHLPLRAKPVAWAVAATAVVALVATGCSSSGNASGDDLGTSGVVKIGVSLPLTGGQSVPGKGHQQGYEFCVDELNANGGLLGHKVQLIVKDSRSDIQTGVNQVRQLISADKVNFLLGSFSTAESFPQETIAEQNRMVYLEPSDSSVQSHSRGYKYIFGQTPKPIDYLGQTPIDALKTFEQAGEISAADAPKTAAVVYEDSFFPVAVSRGILGGSLSVPGTNTKVDFGDGYLAKSGIKVVYKSSFPVDYNDWNSLASAIKASGADYLMVLTVPPLEVNIVKALATVHYKPKGVSFTQGTYPQFKESVGAAANGVIVWTSWDPSVRWEGTLNGKPYSNQTFVSNFTAKVGSAPDEDAAQAFAVCESLANGVYATKSLDNTKIRGWLASRTTQDPDKTIQGAYHFTDTGLTADRDVILLQWQDGVLKPIYPNDPKLIPSVAKVQWPMPNW